MYDERSVPVAPILRVIHEKQLAVFRQLLPAEPLTVNQMRRKMEGRLGYRPGFGWTKARMHEVGLVLSRLDALKRATCSIHNMWMGAECRICSGHVDRCPRCGRCKYADESCSICDGIK